jgi:hypothetical protein
MSLKLGFYIYTANSNSLASYLKFLSQDKNVIACVLLA